MLPLVRVIAGYAANSNYEPAVISQQILNDIVPFREYVKLKVGWNNF